ncbi:Sugar phosphate isomerase/epimerase (YcjR) (PDB:3KTC) (PUBMED:30742415) [Commensalibacter communis]|uniref:sugar phosphate isomerase/epimerase family protein n=1 Tax=Commensalibacter communis TaxID=2972786 RepID=UPI0022FFC10A|nr:sugar phosphate isomerase/epimerase [Commensalibacter communis]CAI3928080.1 Sugar phosphate isomerase/epimerase (YcjR) (PDB:3KTC) (PUBMED:30742415) [Commensalibacter communis]
MKFAYDPSHFRDNTTITEMIHKVADLGYEYIEMSPRVDFCPFYGFPKVDKAMIQTVKKTLSETGVKISSLLPLYHWAGPEEDRRQAAVRNWKRAIEIAVELGVDLMNSEFSGSKYQADVSEEMFIRSMDELLPIFEKEGVRLNLQAHPYDFIETNAGAVNMIRALDKPWIKLVYSTAHAFYYDDGVGDINAQFDEDGDLIDHVLFADTYNHKAAFGLRYIVNPPDAKVTIHQHLNIGEGEVDFDTIFKRLRAMKFDGIATNAVFAWSDKPQESSDFMKKKLKEGLGI